MLTTLSQCIDIYETIILNRYTLELENGDIIKVQFSGKHFHHLIGLHKLKDIPQFQKIPGKQSASVIYKMIKSGKVDNKVVNRSSFYDRIKSRIEYFDLLPDVLSDCKVVVDFDKNKLAFDSELQETKYILYKRLSNGRIIHLTLQQHTNGMASPETFFVQVDNTYLDGQTLLDVVSLKIEKVKNRIV